MVKASEALPGCDKRDEGQTPEKAWAQTSILIVHSYDGWVVRAEEGSLTAWQNAVQDFLRKHLCLCG